MELSSEDALRLNVLVANAEAIRIDENAMVVYGLAGDRELKAPLSPNCSGEKYLTRVRQMLAGTVLDSPGGYPVYLRRWTRMGQVDNEQMHRLLKIGEPEAVMAVVCSPGLTDELARRAWWAAPYSEHARRMLSNPEVAAASMGPVLAEHLVEHLAFETEHCDMLETVRLVLRPGLISEDQRQRLWDAGRGKKTYRVGFLMSQPDDLPDAVAARDDLEEYGPELMALEQRGNVYAGLLRKLLGGPGQTFMDVAADAMRRPADQDVVSAILNAIGNYCAGARREARQFRGVEPLLEEVETTFSSPNAELAALLENVPRLAAEARAMVTLANIDEATVTPIFAHSDAVGSVMRKKIEPVTSVISEQFSILRGLKG